MVTFKQANMKYKDTSGKYVGINTVAERSTEELIAAINSASETALSSQIDSINSAGTAQINSIEEQVDELFNDMAVTSSEINSIFNDL